MMNKTILFSVFLVFILAGCESNNQPIKQEKSETVEQTIQELKIENLLRDSLELAEGIEIVMSYVEVPKGTTLPFHYHPGEEFAYILEGSGELLFEDKTKIPMRAGQAGKVPLKQTHSFSTLNEGAKLVVFRVHEKGQPDRILVD
jgi:quercetin dioxygenase-like cupin family protein